MASATSIRRARKRHRCDGYACRGGGVQPGQLYRRHVMFPGDINSSKQPWVFRECAGCCAALGRPLEEARSLP